MVTPINNKTPDSNTFQRIPILTHPQSNMEDLITKRGTVLFDSSESESELESQSVPLFLPHMITSNLPGEDVSRTNTQDSTTVRTPHVPNLPLFNIEDP